MIHRLQHTSQPAICSQSAKSAKEIKSESRAREAFSQHLNENSSITAPEAATGLIEKAAVSRDVPPYLLLGAALCIEQQSPETTGVAALLEKQPHMQADKEQH